MISKDKGPDPAMTLRALPPNLENKTKDKIDENDDYNNAENKTEISGLLLSSENVVKISSSSDYNPTTREVDKELEEGSNNKSASERDTYHPMDRGYAWVLMIGVFMIQFIMIGYLKSLGILFVEFQDKFGSNASMTSLIIGIMEGSASVGSFVIMNFALKKSSPRTLCLFGSLLATVTITCNCFVTRFEYLCLTQGAGLGISMALVIGPSTFVLTQYFKYRRPMATSFATCGASLGGVVFPLLIRYLLDEYAFQGGILMTGAIIMHSLIFSALFTPVENFPSRRRTKDSKEDITNYSIPLISDNGTNNLKEGAKCRSCDFSLNLIDTKCNYDTKSLPLDSGDICKYLEEHLYSEREDGSKRNNVKIPGDCQQNPEISSHLSSMKSRDQECPLTLAVPTKNRHLENTPSTHPASLNLNPVKSQKKVNGDSAIVLEIDTDFNLSSIRKSQLSKLTASTPSVFRSTSTLHTIYGDVMASEYVDHMKTENETEESSKTFLEKLCLGFLDNRMLKSVSFWLIILFSFCATVANGMPNSFIPALAKERGLSEDDGAFFLSLMGILDFPAHLLPGLIVNCGWLRPSTACIGPLIVIGLVGHLTTFFHTYESLLGMVIVYGLFNGVYFSMNVLLVIELFGFKKYTSVIGCVFMFMGLGGAVSYPLAGYLKDATGTYSSTFHYLATTSLASACVLLVLPLAKRYDMKRGILEDLPVEG